MEFYIDPVEIRTAHTIAKIGFAIRDIQFFTSIKIAIYYFQENGEIFHHPTLPNFIDISGEEYKNWGDDDQYIIDTITSKLGVTIIPAPAPPPPSSPNNIIDENDQEYMAI